MGDFTSRSRSLTRLRIVDEVTDAHLAVVPAKLKQFAFMPIDDTTEERSFGWANFDDMLDTQWKTSPPEKGEYITFSLRLDTRRIPPAVLKRAFREEMDKEEARNQDQGKKFVSRDRRIEIKEQVKLKLMAKAMPIPACFQAVWSLRENTVLLCSTNGKIINMFSELFMRSFGLRMWTCSPMDMVERIIPGGELPDIVETSFVGGESVQIAGQDGILGQDYLLWMWYHDVCGARFIDKNANPFAVNMGQKVVVEGGEEREVVACSGASTTPTESMHGLVKGKRVSRASLIFETQDEVAYSVMLKAGDLSFGPLKTPRVDKGKDDDPDAIFLETMYLVEAAYGMFDASFADFVKLRLNPAEWEKAVAEIGQWIKNSAGGDS